MRAVAAALSLIFLLLACGSVHASQDAGDSSRTAPAFEFHSGFWVNLHHFLYLQGRIERARADSAVREKEIQPQYKLFASTDGLTAEQKKTWNHAVHIYAESWSSRDLSLNNQMLLINDRLAELEDCPDLAGRAARECTSGILPELVKALDEAAPIYRERWWPEQDHANRAWIATITPTVRSMGATLADELANVYQAKWPAKIHVDVVYYASQQGAYTSLGPLHVTVASADDRNRDLTGLQTLFYQASHVLAGGVEQAIERESRRLQKPIPRDLWNAVLLYTTAERTARVRSSMQTAPDAALKSAAQTDGNVLKERGWGVYDLLLRRYWQPYLEGHVDMDTAVAHLINAI